MVAEPSPSTVTLSHAQAPTDDSLGEDPQAPIRTALLRPPAPTVAAMRAHLSCRPSFLKRKPMVRRLSVGGVERTQAR